MNSKAVLTILAVAMCFLLFACAQSGGTESDIAAFQDRVSNYINESSNIESEFNITCVHDYEELSCTAATCTTDGSRLLQCKKCGYETTVALPALNHDWKIATCTAPKTCTRCGKTSGQIKHKYKLASSANATCTKDGINTYRCDVCGDTYSEVMEKAKGHTWKEATCTQSKFCTACGATEGSALGHTGSPYCDRCGLPTTITTGQIYALQAAKSYLEYSEYSREALIDRLIRDDFTQADAEYAAENCGANYFEQALKEAKSRLRYSAYSREALIERLEYEGYTHEEALYGANNCGANWKEQAVKEAKDILKYSSYSKLGMIERLEYEDYTYDEAVYGANNCGADWKEQAIKEAKDILKYSSYSRAGLIEYLLYEDFTRDEAIYGADNCGANWNENAVEEAKSYIKYFPSSRTEVIEYLLGEDFTNSEATYGADNCGANWNEEQQLAQKNI